MGDTPSRRDEKRRHTGERIYEAAMALFRSDGFENVTVSMIAKAARVSVPTFYAHYRTKETMLMPLPTREELASVLAPQPTDLPAAERARAAILLWLEHVDTHSREPVLERWQIIAGTPSLRLRTAEFERATASLVLDVLRAENSREVAPAVVVAVNALMSAYTQIVLRWADEGGKRDLLAIAREVFAELREQL